MPNPVDSQCDSQSHSPAPLLAIQDGKSQAAAFSFPSAAARNEAEDCTVEVTAEESLSPERQVAKLKNFFQRLHRLATAHPPSATHSQSIVRSLIVKLVEGKLSPGEFFTEYQSSSKPTLRPFIVPFLHSSLPMLRQELQTESQKQELWTTLFEETAENGTPSQMTTPNGHISRKRKCNQGDSSSFFTAPWSTDPGMPFLRPRDKLVDGKSSTVLGSPPLSLDLWAWYSDEWKNIENLFTSLVSTMERLRYAMLLFQQRARLSQMWTQQMNRRTEATFQMEEVQRKAETVVQDVKRVAVLELQKAVTAAEQKAFGMVAAERARMETLLKEYQLQELKTENCWNCGRKAGQTCSGCGVARYCGTFCQNKDWPLHRSSCVATPSKIKKEAQSSTDAAYPQKPYDF